MRLGATTEYPARPDGGGPFASRVLTIRATDVGGKPLEWYFTLFADGIDGAAALALPGAELNGLASGLVPESDLEPDCPDCASAPWTDSPYPPLPAAPGANGAPADWDHV